MFSNNFYEKLKNHEPHIEQNFKIILELPYPIIYFLRECSERLCTDSRRSQMRLFCPVFIGTFWGRIPVPSSPARPTLSSLTIPPSTSAAHQRSPLISYFVLWRTQVQVFYLWVPPPYFQSTPYGVQSSSWWVYWSYSLPWYPKTIVRGTSLELSP